MYATDQFRIGGRPCDATRAMNRRTMLVNFRHGLGDAVQFTCILQHFAKYLPDVDVDVAALVGKHSLFRGLCRRRAYILDDDLLDDTRYDAVHDIRWYENYSTVSNGPQTKVTHCLRTELDLPIDETLLRYQIDVSGDARTRAARYLSNITRVAPLHGRFPVVGLHYEGNTSCERKDLSHSAACSRV